MPTIAAFVGRVSTARQATEGSSLETQRKECIAHIEREGWTLLGEFIDVYSGKADSREQLDLLLDRCRAGEVQAVVVYKLDRLGRNLRHLVNVSHELQGLGVRLVFVKEGVDTETAVGRLFFNVLASIAEFEWERIRERTLEGRAEAFSNGVWTQGKVPFGFCVAAGAVEVESREAKVIATAVSLLLDGHTLSQVRDTLNGLGSDYAPREKDGWLNRDLRNALTNTALAGSIETKAGPYAVPALVGEFAELQRTLRASAHARPADREVYPLSGRTKSPCGKHAIGQGSVMRGTRYRYYRCRDYHPNSPHTARCTCLSVNAEAAEELVWRTVLQFLGDSQRLFELFGLNEGALIPLRDDDAKLQKSEDRLRRQLGRVLTVEDELEGDDFAQAVRDLNAQIKAIRQQRDALAKARVDPPKQRKALLKYVRLAEVLMAGTSNRETQERIYEMLGLEVEVAKQSPLEVRIKGLLPSEITVNEEVLAGVEAGQVEFTTSSKTVEARSMRPAPCAHQASSGSSHVTV